MYWLQYRSRQYRLPAAIPARPVARKQPGCDDHKGMDANAALVELVEFVRGLPYGRPVDRSIEGMLREGRGTCSTKHLFLANVLREHFPWTEPEVVHRVYRLDREGAVRLFGTFVAKVVPSTGLIDVHRYITIHVGNRRITLDATFPGPAWDGRSSLPLACGPGDNYPAGPDPDAEKRALEEKHCDLCVREQFIAALSSRLPRVSDLPQRSP